MFSRETAARTLWDPVPPQEDVWMDSYSRLYGPEAAPHVVKAFGQSEAILRDGLTTGDYLLLDHEGISPGAWLPGGAIFRMFRKPGNPLVSDHFDELGGMDLLLWQSRTWLGAKGAIDIRDFRERNASAQKAASLGLAEIEAARAWLTGDRYEELARNFLDAQIVLKAIGLLGEAAYRANLVLDNNAGKKETRANC